MLSETQPAEATESRGEKKATDRAEMKSVVSTEKTEDSTDDSAKVTMTAMSEVDSRLSSQGSEWKRRSPRSRGRGVPRWQSTESEPDDRW